MRSSHVLPCLTVSLAELRRFAEMLFLRAPLSMAALGAAVKTEHVPPLLDKQKK